MTFSRRARTPLPRLLVRFVTITAWEMKSFVNWTFRGK